MIWAILFLIGVAPIGRLIFVEEGKIEQALSMEPVRRAFTLPYRAYFWRARLASLAAYVPAGLLVALMGWLLVANAPLPLIVLNGWLLCSAGVFAQLVGAQLYVAAERQAQLMART